MQIRFCVGLYGHRFVKLLAVKFIKFITVEDCWWNLTLMSGLNIETAYRPKPTSFLARFLVEYNTHLR